MCYEDESEPFISHQTLADQCPDYDPVTEAEMVLRRSLHPWREASRKAGKRLLEEMAHCGEFYNQTGFLQLPPA